MSRLSKWLRSFRKKKACTEDCTEGTKACTTTTVVKDPKTDPNKEVKVDVGEVFEAGEKTVYDCIVEGKELGLDMREINATLSAMTKEGKSGKEFVIWFEVYKNQNS